MMVHNRDVKPRRGGGVQDARDVIRTKRGRKSAGVRSSSYAGTVLSKRIIRTAGGLVTNKRPKGISTSQLQHRQRDQKSRASVSNRFHHRPARSTEGLPATLRRSAVVSSSPVFQSILCYLMPMDLTVGARPGLNVDDDDAAAAAAAAATAATAAHAHTADSTVTPNSARAAPNTPDVKAQKTDIFQDLNRNEANLYERAESEEFNRLENSIRDNIEGLESERLNIGNNSLAESCNNTTHNKSAVESDCRSDLVAEIDANSQSIRDSEGSESEIHLLPEQLDLPKTCQVLKAPNGCTVYVIGSAHFSRQSQNDVRQVIRSVRPKKVMVELCKQRLHILTLDEHVLLRESSGIGIQTVRETVSRMGALQGGMYLLLMQLSAHLTSKLKIAPGGEFRVAYKEANELDDCQVFLGDRQINITLKRAWASLGIWQRLSIAWTLLFSDEDISMEDVERCKEKDILEQLLGEMCIKHPDLSRVLVSERDLYLCRSLYNIAMTPPDDSSVVAVVGIGHQQGIIKYWEDAESIDLHQLNEIPEPSLAVRLTNKTFRVGMWLGIGLIVYKLTPQSIRSGILTGLDKGVSYGAEKMSKLKWIPSFSE